MRVGGVSRGERGALRPCRVRPRWFFRFGSMSRANVSREDDVRRMFDNVGAELGL
jgi:hypothetical protein